MNSVFNQVLMQGSTAASPASSSSSTSRHYVAQKSGDPNYYASKPTFDSRGFWHSAGTFAPYDTPSGEPITPSEGEWIQKGTTTRNGESTSFWVWYPPSNKSITLGSSKVGSTQYVISRSQPSSSSSILFLRPDYWVHKQVVPKPPPAPKSHYTPIHLEYEAPEGIVPVTGTFVCKHWLLVATDGDSRLNATLPGAMFKPLAVFNFYQKYDFGSIAYFTYDNHLFRFEYTGYDPTTHTWKHGSQYKYIISMCVDGLNVQKNPSGDVANYTVYYQGGGAGGLLVVHQKKGVGQAREKFMDTAFDVKLRPGPSTAPLCAPCSTLQGGIAATHETAMMAIRDENCIAGLGRVFNVGLLRASVKGLGQLVDGATLAPIPAADVPLVYGSDWTEFYPKDPWRYQQNTNLGPGALPQQLYGLVNQINSSAPGSTVYWYLHDPNSGAAWTVSSLGAEVALIRSSYPGGSLKLEIARKTVPAPMKLVSGATLSDGSACGAGSVAKWVRTDIATAEGLEVKLGSGIRVLTDYLQYVQQPQFRNGVPPSGSQTDWPGGFGVPVPVPTSAPDVFFTYGGQLYKVSWNGSFPSPGGPEIYLCTNVAKLTPPIKVKQPPPVIPFPGTTFPWLSPVTAPVVPVVAPTMPSWMDPTAQLPSSIMSASAAAAAPTMPSWMDPTAQLPSSIMSASAAAAASAAPPPSPVMGAPAAAPATASAIPTSVMVAGAILGLAVVGGVAYLVLE